MEDLFLVKKLEMEQFKERLSYNFLDYHPIIYSDNAIYEFNYITGSIRPFNSVIWYEPDKKYTSLISFMRSKCKEFIRNNILEDNDLSGTEIGYYSEGCIIINTEDIESCILYNYTIPINLEIQEMIELLQSFCRYLNTIYLSNEASFLNAIKGD